MRFLLLLVLACSPAAPGTVIPEAGVDPPDASACAAIPCDLLSCDALMVCDVVTDACVCPSNGAGCTGVPASCATSCAGWPVTYWCEPRGLCFCEPVYCAHF